MLPKGWTPKAAGTAKQRLLGSDRDPAGGRVVTYHGWPLYTYVGDRNVWHIAHRSVRTDGRVPGGFADHRQL